MMVIILDPHFKLLHVVKNLVGHGIAIWLVFKYDVKVVIPLLMISFNWLNLLPMHMLLHHLMLWD